MDKHCLSRVLGCPHTLGKTFSSPVYQPSDAEFVHPSLMIFFINILSHCGEAAHSQRKLFGHRNRCSSCVVLSLVSVFCCPVLTGTVSLGQECRHNVAGVFVPGSTSCSQVSVGQVPVPALTVVGRIQSRVVGLRPSTPGGCLASVASRNGFRVFCVVTFVTQCEIQTFHCGVKTSLTAASSAGRGAPLINMMARAAAGPTTSGRQAAVQG